MFRGGGKPPDPQLPQSTSALGKKPPGGNKLRKSPPPGYSSSNPRQGNGRKSSVSGDSSTQPSSPKDSKNSMWVIIFELCHRFFTIHSYISLFKVPQNPPLPSPRLVDFQIYSGVEVSLRIPDYHNQPRPQTKKPQTNSRSHLRHRKKATMLISNMTFMNRRNIIASR